MGQSGWAARSAAGPTRSRRVLVRRAAWTAAAAALAAVLVWTLTRPFAHPRTHLVLLAGDVLGADSDALAVPADYVVEDFRDLLKLTPALHRSLGGDPAALVLGSLRSPDEMQQLAERLNERLTGQRDALLVYVSAHGFTQDGDTWLIASGADPDAPLGGRYRMATLLAQLRAVEAATKVLLVDAGRMEYDPLRGLVENDFPSRLADQVGQLGDDRLWVLISHADGQRSHTSPALRQSVFGYFVAAGLRGAADANNDRAVDLSELAEFVVSAVSGWVRQTSGGAAEQSPLLAWGGGELLFSPWPVLISVPRRSEPPGHEFDHARAVERAQRERADQERPKAAGSNQESAAAERARRELDSLIASGLARSTPSGRLGHFISQKARQALANVLPGAASGEQAPESSAAAESKPPPSGKAKASSGEPKDRADDGAKGGVKDGTKGGDQDDASSASSNDTSSAKANGNQPAAENGGAAEATKEPSDTPPQTDQPLELTPESRHELEMLVRRGWMLRDELLAPDRAAPRPADEAPALWRELEHKLLLADRKLRTGAILRPAEFAEHVRPLVGSLELLAGRQPHVALAPDSYGRQIHELARGRALAGVRPTTLAAAELLARMGARPLPGELAAMIASLDRVIAAGNRTDLEKLAAELTGEHDQWRELRLARRLAERPDLDWRLIQLLLDSVRTGERAAAFDLAAARWTASRIARADAARQTAERQLLATVSLSRDALIALLTGSLELYRQALDDLRAVQSAQRLANDVWRLAPEYFTLAAAASAGQAPGASEAQLHKLLDRLEALELLLEVPDENRLPALREAAAALAAAKVEVERGIGALAVEQLVSRPFTPGEAWHMELLLESLAPPAEVREALAAVHASIDAAAAAQVQTSPGGSSVLLSPPVSLPADVTACVSRGRLQSRLWAVALELEGGAENLPLGNAARALAAVLDPQGRRGADSARDECELVASRLQDVYVLLPVEITRAADQERGLARLQSRDAALARLRGWDRLHRLLDPRQRAGGADRSLATALRNAAAYDWLVWMGQRAHAAVEDAPPAEAAFHLAAAADHRQAAALIPGQPPVPQWRPGPVQIQAPANISLTYLSRREIELTIDSTASGAAKAWLVVETDEQLVEFTSSDGRPIYRWSEVSAAEAGPAGLAGAVQGAARLRPTVELVPGRAVKLPLRVARRKASLRPAHAVLRVLTEHHLARHDLSIELPPPEDLALAVAGPLSRWSARPAGVELFPYPNRVNSFALTLASGKPAERSVDVEVYPILSPPPHGFPAESLRPADAAKLRAAMTIGPLIAECRALALPASTEAVAAVLVAPEPALPAPAPANGKVAAAPPPVPPGGKPPPLPLTSGLVAIVTDLADKRQTFRELAIAPQRPQRYVQPRVRYRAARERVEIRVTAQDSTLLPTEGARLRAEFFEPLAEDAERQLEGVLKPGQGEAELFAEVSSAPGKTVTLALSVDDYPRAFYYRVPVSGETSDIAEDLDLVAVRIAALPAGTIYQPPQAAIPVQLAVDAPASVLQSPPLRIEVGLDRNRDRELLGDETVLLKTDRQVTASLAGISKAGELQIDVRVGDLRVDVPAAALTATRANVLARVLLGDNEAWSQPVEVVFDDQPPKVAGVALRPADGVVLGESVAVSVLADDAGLSGVARIEAAFDVERSGAFGPETKAVIGALGDDGRWLAALPTAGLSRGAYNVLVRAVDRAGNAGQPARATIRVLTAAEAEAEAVRSNAADIAGVVVYGNAPQAAVTVRLLREAGALPPPKKSAKGKAPAPPPPPLAQATTDAKGQFTFPKVPPGKYLVQTESLIHNKVRTASASVSFAKPAEVQPLTLSLK